MTDPLSDDLRAAEIEIDRYHLTNLLTRKSFAEAGWYFLGFCEELVVRDLIQQDAESLHEIAAAVDNLIVHAKVPLQWLSRACPPGGVIPRGFNDDLYEAAWRLSELSMEYLAFESAFTYATWGLVSLELDGKRIRTSGPMRNDSRFDAYDRLTQNHEVPRMAPAAQSFLDRIAASVRVRDDWFDYDLNPSIVRAGLEALGHFHDDRFILPPDWKLPRFTLQEFALVARALWVLAFIHFHARMTAAERGCKGLGFSRALILMDKGEIVPRLRRYSGVNESTVISIVEDLTYGARGQTNPDPALQPLIPLSASTFAIAPNILMSSSMERNLSVLLNRLPAERQAYAKLSKDRETMSRKQIIDQLSERGFRFWHGQVPEWGTASDIDLAIISDVEQQCLILELKSFIAPAEAREIRDRSEEIRRGIEQMKIRIQMAQTLPEGLRRVLKVSSLYKLGWGVVSETSIGAAYVQSADVPVVNIAHLLAYLRKEPTLAKCCQWLQRREYLPIEGVHYQKVEIEARIGEWVLEWYGIRGLVDNYMND